MRFSEVSKYFALLIDENLLLHNNKDNVTSKLKAYNELVHDKTITTVHSSSQSHRLLSDRKLKKNNGETKTIIISFRWEGN